MMTAFRRFTAACVAFAFILGAGSAIAADQPSSAQQSTTRAAPTKEQREQMAKMHEQMATCLRSDKTMRDCHDEMRKSCESTPDACPMMGKGGMRHGKKDKSTDSAERTH